MTPGQATPRPSPPEEGTYPPGSHAARFLGYSRIFGAIVALQGAIALSGWVFGVEALKGGGYSLGITVKTNTAIALLLCGLALILLAPRRRNAAATWIGHASAAIAAAIGLATLVEHLTGLDLGIDQALYRESAGVIATTSPNRMGPPASICFPLIGFSYLLLHAATPVRRRLHQLLAGAALLVCTVPILGYIYGLQELYGIARYTGIAFPTALCFMLLSLGSLFARPDVGVTRLLAAEDEGGIVVRRLLPAAILLPIALGWIRTVLEGLGYFDPAFGRTLLTLSFILVFSALTLWNGTALSKLAAARARAEDAERELTSRLLEALDRERASRESAEHANRMKDEFLATLSHELRTPLNAILGWATVLAQGAGAEHDMKRGLETIERNSKLQARLIEDLLDMSRIVSGNIRLEPRDVDLCAMIDAAIAATTPTADGKGVVLERDLEVATCVVRGDPERLHQILWNLLTNAMKFTPRGGRVRVDLRVRGEDAVITVSDTGVGISRESLERIFEQFHQADTTSTRRHGGLGLGLSIARRLAELHGGTVTAESDGEGKGSRFTVTLPRHSDRFLGSGKRHTDGDPTENGADVLRGVRVLVVDDDPDGRDLAGTILKDRGAEVVTADGYAGALREIERSSFDLLVCDIAMPDRDGYDVIREVRKRVPELPAIALTAFTHEANEQRALRAGFQLHLSRPVDPGRLVAAAAELAPARKTEPA